MDTLPNPVHYKILDHLNTVQDWKNYIVVIYYEYYTLLRNVKHTEKYKCLCYD
jgi:hypothetical protein